MAETKVIMPQMGESIFEGTLTKWLKKKGDRVQRDEPLFEISTDKIDSEIPAPASGVLQDVLVTEGQTVQINTVVAVIGDTGRNFAAGMSGGIAYVWDPAGRFASLCNTSEVELEPIDPAEDDDDADPEDRPRQFRRLKVEVSVPDVVVHARKGYYPTALPGANGGDLLGR